MQMVKLLLNYFILSPAYVFIGARFGFGVVLEGAKHFLLSEYKFTWSFVFSIL